MRKIVTYPNPVLRQVAEAVEEIDGEIRQLVEEMTDAMYADDGVGLAAPQLGVSKRIVVVDAGEGLTTLINPEIVRREGEEISMEEGCLSLPEIRVNVSRPTRALVRGMNEEGEPVEIEAEGLLARVFQHEIDHLNGILIIDHASTVERSLLKPRLRKLEKEAH